MRNQLRVASWLAVVAVAGVASGCGGGCGTTAELTEFVSCMKGTRGFTATGAARGGFATVLLTTEHGDVVATVVAYQLANTPKLGPTAADLLKQEAGFQVPFTNNTIRGRAVVSYAVKAPESGIPTRQAQAVRARVVSCLSRRD